VLSCVNPVINIYLNRRGLSIGIAVIILTGCSISLTNSRLRCSTVTFNFNYKNLKIDPLKKVDGKAELQKRGLVSTLANKLILSSNNPDEKGVFRPGPVDIKREETTSFFSFLYKCILDRLKPGVGSDKKKEGNVNKAVAWVDSVVTKVNGLLDKFHKFKEDRKARREALKAAKQAKKNH